MKNYIQESRMITVAAPSGGLAASAGVVIGNLFGIAASTVLVGEQVAISTEGVYELPKLASAVIAAGARVSWDDTAKQINVPATGRFPVGNRDRRRRQWRCNRARSAGRRVDGGGVKRALTGQL